MEQASAHLRHELRIAIQQQEAVLIQQQAHVANAATRAQTAEQEREDMARSKHSANPSKTPARLWSHSAEWDHNLHGISLGQELIEATSWAKGQNKHLHGEDQHLPPQSSSQQQKQQLRKDPRQQDAPRQEPVQERQELRPNQEPQQTPRQKQRVRMQDDSPTVDDGRRKRPRVVESGSQKMETN